MLEQLQRLQAQISTLKTHLKEVEGNHDTLLQQKNSSEEQLHAQITLKDNIITQKHDDFEKLNHQHTELKTQFNKLNTDASSLAERYSRLEKSCTDLKNRFQEILAERNDLRLIKEKMLAEQLEANQKIQDLNSERARLIQKNEHAKMKVEAIIERLAILGTEQDQHAQEIQQLAHPTEMNEEAS